MSTGKSTKKILNVEKEKRRIISKLLSVDMMLRGSYVHIHTKCGKDNCWCSKAKKGHPHSRITWSERGRTITRRVPRKHKDWIQEMLQNYRQFRSLRRRLVDLETETKKLLDVLENELVKKTRGSKIFSGTNTQNRRKTSRLASKKDNLKKTVFT